MMALWTTFTVPSYTVNFIQVYRNGVLLGTADFTATSGTTVVLSTGATAGDLVTTISFYVSSVLGAIPAASGAVTNAYLGAISTFTTPTSKTVTLPDVTGTVMVSGNMPAFSYAMTTQNISTSTSTLVTWNTKNFDTANSFNATSGTVGTAPAWSFNPQVAGYYQVNMQVITGGSNYFSIGSGAIYKNGSIYRSSASNFNGGTGLMNYSLASLGDVIYMNGSTDYLQVYAYSTATSAQVIGGNGFAAGGPASLFSAVLVRTA